MDMCDRLEYIVCGGGVMKAFLLQIHSMTCFSCLHQEGQTAEVARSALQSTPAASSEATAPPVPAAFPGWSPALHFHITALV